LKALAAGGGAAATEKKEAPAKPGKKLNAAA